MKRRKPEHVNLERWLISYADFITLLFAFFVIMYAISQADLVKFQKLAGGMKKAFNGSAGAAQSEGSAGGNTVNILDHAEVPAGRTNTVSAPESDEELQRMKDLLEETISLDTGGVNIADQMQLLYDSRGLILRLAIKDLFPEGEVDAPSDLRPLLDKIGNTLKKTTRQIRIEGHTDPAEASVASFPSDWELSASRAAWVARYWISRVGLDPKKIAVAGYGHFHPIVQAQDEWFRGGNRRIEVIILNSRYDSKAATATKHTEHVKATQGVGEK